MKLFRAQVWSFSEGWGDLWVIWIVSCFQRYCWMKLFTVAGLSLDMNDEETDGWWLCGFPEVLLNEILHRVPAMEDAEVRQLINGPETFTPDSSWLLGETAEVCGFWLQTSVNLVYSSSLLFGQWCLMFGGIAQWLECRTCDWKVAGSNPCRSGRRIFLSGVNFLCWLLFQYLFHPCLTAVAHKRSQSFCQNSR